MRINYIAILTFRSFLVTIFDFQSIPSDFQQRQRVDALDEKCAVYCTGRRTKRWAIVRFFRILDFSGVIDLYFTVRAKIIRQ